MKIFKDNNEFMQFLKDKTRSLFVSIFNIVLNAIFLVVWIFIQYGLQKVMDYVQLNEVISSTLLKGFQVTFAISTFILIFLGLIQEIIQKFYQTKESIKK